MNAPTPSTIAPWTAPPAEGWSAFSASAIGAGVVWLALAVIGFIVTRSIAGIISEYAKLWHFRGIPPWRVTRELRQDVEGLTNALAAREAEFEATRASVEKMLANAERLEEDNIRLTAENADLRLRLRAAEAAHSLTQAQSAQAHNEESRLRSDLITARRIIALLAEIAVRLLSPPDVGSRPLIAPAADGLRRDGRSITRDPWPEPPPRPIQ